MALLGNTLEKIAGEKAGIIKSGIPAIVGVRDKEYDFVFEERAASVNTTLSFAGEQWKVEKNPEGNYHLKRSSGEEFCNLSCELKGDYQRKNIPTVLETIPALRAAGLQITDEQVRTGISRVITNTGLHGRWQTLAQSPLTICDTGHNIDGITEIVQQLQKCQYEQLHFVIGMVNDKDVDHVLCILPKDAIYYFTKASIPRAMNEEILAEKSPGGRSAWNMLSNCSDSL